MEKVFIRTVTYHYTGLIRAETPEYIELTSAAWIADSGRFSDAMSSGVFDEVEPYPDNCVVRVYKASIVDVSSWGHALPREQK